MFTISRNSGTRQRHSIPILQINDAQAIANGAAKFLGPNKINTFSNGCGVPIPTVYTRFRISVFFAWTSNPAADSFPFYVRFDNPNQSGSSLETLHGTQFGASVYPNDTSGLSGTLSDLGAAGGSANSFRFISNWATIPIAWQANAFVNGFYSYFGVVIGNNSGGSLTDNFAGNRSCLGIIELD